MNAVGLRQQETGNRESENDAKTASFVFPVGFRGAPHPTIEDPDAGIGPVMAFARNAVCHGAGGVLRCAVGFGNQRAEPRGPWLDLNGFRLIRAGPEGQLCQGGRESGRSTVCLLRGTDNQKTVFICIICLSFRK